MMVKIKEMKLTKSIINSDICVDSDSDIKNHHCSDDVDVGKELIIIMITGLMIFIIVRAIKE